jgi:hypothetical protein
VRCCRDEWPDRDAELPVRFGKGEVTAGTSADAELATTGRQDLAALTTGEGGRCRARRPRSSEAFAAAGQRLPGYVPMTCRRMWPGGFPLYLAHAHGTCTASEPGPGRAAERGAADIGSPTSPGSPTRLGRR